VKQIDSEKKLDRLKLRKLLETIYSSNTTEEINFISNQLLQILDDFSEKSSFEEISDNERWDESYSVLITYADSVYKNGESTLITLRKLLSKHFGSLSKVLHILPFLKSTSDGGFAVSSFAIFTTWAFFYDERFHNFIIKIFRLINCSGFNCNGAF